jgi:hypothetical protein
MSKTCRIKSKSTFAEPHFYISLVLKGSEEQYLNLLKYVNSRDGSQVIYQTKSATYLRVTRDEQKIEMIADSPVEIRIGPS